jgi:ABC-type nitrate/sulfonate/bicarbonate transport system substrate-binding protein
MRRKMQTRFLFMFLSLMAFCSYAQAGVTPTYTTPVKPFAKKITKSATGGNIPTSPLLVPMITWGADGATIVANEGATTKTNSIFGKLGLKLTLKRQDDFVQQVKDYVAGKTPFLRGTMGMVNIASSYLAKLNLQPVVFLKMSWSEGGDVLVVKKNIKSIKDLKGKVVVLQQYSPHIDYFNSLLKDADLVWSDVTVRWAKELTTPPYDTKGKALDPATIMRNDPSVDAAFVISPDAAALTLGPNALKGVKTLISTKTASRVISDVYAVRPDFLQNNKALVEKFVIGYLRGVRYLKALTGQIKSVKVNAKVANQELTKVSKLLFGNPNMLSDTKGLISDCNMVGLSGNRLFFTNKKDPVGFQSLTQNLQNFLIEEGYIAKKTAPKHASWDYSSLEKKVGEKSTTIMKPRFNTQKVAKYLATAGDKDVIFSFEIRFQPNQYTFPEKKYAKSFAKVLSLSRRYAGSIIEVVGHSDPNKVRKLRHQKKGLALISEVIQKARNLSLQRSNSVKKSIAQFSKSRNVLLDSTQFSTTGKGISEPRYPAPRTKAQWLSNMRVIFRVRAIEAEMNNFELIP